jgi:hypothetical protein
MPFPCREPAILRECCFTLATASEIGMLLITNFLELGVASRQHAVTLPPRPCHEPAMASRGRFLKGIFVAWQGNGMACVNQTLPHCVNQMGNTKSKALVERLGRGTAGEWHGKSMGTAWYVWIRLKSFHYVNAKCYDYELTCAKPTLYAKEDAYIS